MSALLEALRTRQPLPAPKVAQHRAETGCSLVELGDVRALAYYAATMVGADELVEVESISIGGREVPAYMLAADVLSAWAAQIKAERADDLRTSRAAWEARQ